MDTTNIGNFLKEKRISLDLTMKYVADYVGVSESTISRWESGEIKNMKRDKIQKLSTVLKIDPAMIMGWTDGPSQIEKTLIGLDKEFYDKYQKLNPDSQSLVDSLIELLQAEQPDSGKVLEMIGRLSAILHS